MKLDGDKKISLFESLKLIWKFELKYIIPNFLRGVKNLYFWFPIIWKDRDWDYSFLLEVMKFKISRMSKNHVRTSYVGQERNIERMNLAIILIDKIQNEYYKEEHLDYLEQTFEFVKMENSEYFQVKKNIKKNESYKYFEKYPLVYKKVLERQKEENFDDELKAILMGDILHNKAKKLLYKILENHSEYWWS